MGKDAAGAPLPCALRFRGDHPAQAPPAPGDGDDACGAFSPAQYYGSLGSATAALGRVLLTAGSTLSTQALVQENIAHLPDGLVFVADRQVGGKGERAGAGSSIESI